MTIWSDVDFSSSTSSCTITLWGYDGLWTKEYQHDQVFHLARRWLLIQWSEWAVNILGAIHLIEIFLAKKIMIITSKLSRAVLLPPIRLGRLYYSYQSVCVGYVARSSQIAQDMLVALSRLRRVGCSQFIMIINRKAEKLHILDTLLSLQQSSDKSSACNRRSYCGIDW